MWSFKPWNTDGYKHIYSLDTGLKRLLAWCWCLPRAYNTVENLKWFKPITEHKMSVATMRTENIIANTICCILLEVKHFK